MTLSRKINKFDQIYFGTLLGLIIPLMLFLGFYMIKKENQSVMEFINSASIKFLMTKIISICTLPNLGIFYFFINKEMYKSGKGVILAVFIIVFWVLYRMIA